VIRVKLVPLASAILDWFNIKFHKRSGFSLIEVLFAVAIFAILSIGVVMLSVSTLQREARVIVDIEAQTYVEEGIEATRNIRDQDFLELNSGTHGLTLESDGWSFEGSSDVIDSYFIRSIAVDDVYRDGNGDIVDTGGSLDLNTKKITSTVTWTYKGVFPRSLSLSTYLTNWTAFDWMQTTCTEFNSGSHTNTTTQPSAVPPADNCVLNLDVIEEAGSFFVSADIGTHGNDVFVDGDYVYVAANKNNKGLEVVDISDLQNPVAIDHVDLGEKGRYVYKYGDVLYVGVQKSSNGFAVVDVSNPNDVELEQSINVGGSGNEITVSGTILYMGVENASGGLKIFDVIDPEEPALLSTLDLGEKVRSVDVSGNYAYLGVDDSALGFQVADVSDPENPSIVATLDVGNEVNSMWIYGAFAYVAIDSTSNSLQVVDISNPLAPSVLSTLDLSREIKDLAVSGSYLYVALDEVNEGLAVINVTSPTVPSLSYIVDVSGKGTSVSVDGDSVYVGTETSNKGLVITGQADISVASSGNYVSQALDTGSSDTRYNYLDWELTEAPGSTTSFQVKTANSLSALSSAQWVGPDGTGASFFDTKRTAIIPDSGASGTQYIQVIVYMTSDGFTTPSIESLTVNYTP